MGPTQFTPRTFSASPGGYWRMANSYGRPHRIGAGQVFTFAKQVVPDSTPAWMPSESTPDANSTKYRKRSDDRVAPLMPLRHRQNDNGRFQSELILIRIRRRTPLDKAPDYLGRG